MLAMVYSPHMLRNRTDSNRGFTSE